MTRKHFQAAATVIRNIHEDSEWCGDCKPEARRRAYQTAVAFITFFSDSNPHFDRERFLAACGLDGEKN